MSSKNINIASHTTLKKSQRDLPQQIQDYIKSTNVNHGMKTMKLNYEDKKPSILGHFENQKVYDFLEENNYFVGELSALGICISIEGPRLITNVDGLTLNKALNITTTYCANELSFFRQIDYQNFSQEQLHFLVDELKSHYTKVKDTGDDFTLFSDDKWDVIRELILHPGKRLNLATEIGGKKLHKKSKNMKPMKSMKNSKKGKTSKKMERKTKKGLKTNKKVAKKSKKMHKKQ